MMCLSLFLSKKTQLKFTWECVLLLRLLRTPEKLLRTDPWGILVALLFEKTRLHIYTGVCPSSPLSLYM
jgi:hypothetical protein